jgi:pilus assembly protein CpaF
LVKNALRMRPDRIIVGECRGGETLDMLQAMNTGHDGSLSHCPLEHAARHDFASGNAVADVGPRLAGARYLKQIASAVQLIVQQSRLSDGSRKITHITEVQGMEGDTLLLQDLFLFEQKGRGPDGKIVGRHISTGFRPKCVAAIEAAGYPLPRDLFAPD